MGTACGQKIQESEVGDSFAAVCNHLSIPPMCRSDNHGAARSGSHLSTTGKEIWDCRSRHHSSGFDLMVYSGRVDDDD